MTPSSGFWIACGAALIVGLLAGGLIVLFDREARDNRAIVIAGCAIGAPIFLLAGWAAVAILFGNSS